MTPDITVVMSVYNGNQYLSEAINSILTQTYSNFEFIIIDDGSTDTSWALLKSYQDIRICLIRNERNLGLSKSLNIGLAEAKGNFIARMDSDDFCYPTRLEKQISYIKLHPEIGILGTSYENIDQEGQLLSVCQNPTNHNEILWSNMAIAHPTVMMRYSVLKQIGGYQVDGPAQDYDLWMRASAITKLANLPEVLLKYRIHTNSISQKKQDVQYKNSIKIVRKFCSKFLGWDIGNTGAECLYKSAESLIQKSSDDVKEAAKLIEKLCHLYIERQHLTGPDKRKVFFYSSNQLSKLAYINRKKYHLASIKAVFSLIKLTPQRLFSKKTLRVILGM
jgi:glycosyltransferase involved in cell wall biosynthesis